MTKNRFPHPIYAQTVLKPAYQDAAEYLYEPMLAANQAQVIMLVRQNIISEENASPLLKALLTVKSEGLATLKYQSGVEDLFFLMENKLIEIVGPEHGGNLQLARSRNDLGQALTRLAVRPILLELCQQLLHLRQSVDSLAKDHLETVDAPQGLFESLGKQGIEVLKGKTDYLVVYNSEEDIRAINPNFAELGKIDARGVIVTARGKHVDFVSR